jgi:hypothetical protein
MLCCVVDASVEKDPAEETARALTLSFKIEEVSSRS